MKKITILLIASLFAISAATQAQTFKFGHLNVEELVTLMPDFDSLQVKVGIYQKDLEQLSQEMIEEYMKKNNEYQQKAATWTATVLEAKQQELQEMGQRYQNFEQKANQDLQQYYQSLMIPIYTKVQNAIKEVGNAENYTYIVDLGSGTFPFASEKTSTNLMSKMKDKLGIPQDKKLPGATQ